MKTLLILPTYNESMNLENIVAQIVSTLPKIKILIVDDNSPDGTGKIADSLAKVAPQQIQVLHRPKKEGLGKAYWDAFHYFLKSDSEFLVHMDADLSHPPSLLPTLLENLQNHDVALGSRYVKGGGVQNWGLTRRLLSRIGNLYAKNILSLPIKDLTGGFKAFRRKAIENLVQFPIDSKGYFFQIETTARSYFAGFSMIEVPYTFKERASGVSKMSNEIVREALIKTWRLKKSLKAKLPDALVKSSV